ncbi:MAG: response regulator [Bacilli bacterium]|nr:response regulator [Bacilli bacterium]
MGSGIFFPVCALPISLIIIITFHVKGYISSEETKLYNRLIIANLIGLVIEIMCSYACEIYTKNYILSTFILKSYLVYLIVWTALFTTYIFRISADKVHNVFKMIHLLILIIVNGIIYILPINVVIKNNFQIHYTNGPSVDFAYLVSFVYVIVILLILLKNIKNIRNKKYLPVFLFFIIGTISIVVQKNYPQFLLFTYFETIICLCMYFTIENPDVKMIEQLEIAKNSADKANRAKTDFLSSMSHEIRTPLNAIVGFSDCITEAKDLDEAKENAKDIVNASETLLEIVNGILDISKIEAGKLEIVNSTYNAHELFEELAKLIKPKMDDKALDFKYYIAPDLPNVLYGDHASIKKIVTNLLSNASKYTDKGFVNYEVNCIRSNDTCKLIISVEDSGRGIKKESVDKLFNKFQRVDEDRNTTIEGTGLGLAITKQLIELMGGKIIVHTVYGEGSKFTVMLDQKIEKAVVREKVNTVSDNLDLSNSKILIVDDNELNLKVATKLLGRYNATDIDCVESGFECLDKINSGNKYDVILLDDMMPKMSGVETLKKLKEKDGFNIPVVALTANAITGMKEKYLSQGFNDYLAKPIEKNDLITVMNRVLNNNEVNTGATISNSISKLVSDETEVLDEENNNNSSFDGEKYLRDNGIDMDKALELLGDMEMYNDTLDDYLSEVDSKLEELKKYKESNDMENYAILVHSMKSDAKYLGFMDFADIAYQHELKSKDNDSEFVNDNFEKLEEELNKVLKIVKEYKEKI